MPSININEVDNTIYNLSSLDNNNIVLLCGDTITGPYDDFKLYNNFEMWKNDFGTYAPEGSPTFDIVQGLMAAKLPVLFRRVVGSNQDTSEPTLLISQAQTVLKFKETTVLEEEPVTTETEELIVKELYGGSLGNNYAVTIEKIGNVYYFKLYIGTKLVETYNLAYLTGTETEEVTRAALVEGIRRINSQRIEVSFSSNTPDKDFKLPIVTKQNLTGGADIPHSSVSAEIVNLFNGTKLRDKYVYDFKFITSAGYTDASAAATPIATAMVNLAEDRQDCIAILDVPQWTNKYQVQNYFANIDSSYAAAYAPWCYIRTVSGGEAWMPPSYLFLYTLGRSIQSGSPNYLAPAGVVRASVPQVIKPEYEIGGDILDLWQGSSPQCINPIMKLRSYGYVIYGQRTLYNILNTAKNTISALQRVNNRLAVNGIKKHIFNIALRLTFQPNKQRTWNEFTGYLDPILLNMKLNDGITDYQVKMDDTTTSEEDIANNTIRAIVKVSVSNAIENFEIDFVLEPQSVTFAEEDNERNVAQ